MPADADTVEVAVDEEREERLSHAPAVMVERLVDSYREFQGFLEAQVGSRAVSVEIMQDAFVRGMHKLDLVHAEETSAEWFYRLLRHAVIDQPRHSGLFDHKLTAFRVELEQKLQPSIALAAAIERCISGLAMTLEPEQRDLLRGVEWQGVAPDERDPSGLTQTLFSAESSSTESVAAESVAAASSAVESGAVHSGAVDVASARAALRRQVVSACGTCTVHGRWNCTCGSGLAGYGHPR